LVTLLINHPKMYFPKYQLLTLTLILSFGLTYTSLAQNWTQKTSLPVGEERYGAAGFTLNGKGYVGIGDNGTNLLTDIWEYEPTTDSWTQKADFIGGGRRVGVSFVIDTLAFVGVGWTGSSSLFDFFSYDAFSNTWTQINDYPGLGGRNCFKGNTSGKGYVGGGALNATTFYSDWWEYNPTNDTWTQKANLPTGPRAAGISFSINDMVYIGMGQDGNIDFKDLWAYNPNTDSWSQKTDFPGVERIQADVFVVDGIAVVGGGYELGVGGSSPLSDYYAYNPNNDTWTSINTFANGARSISATFTIGSKGYIATGWDNQQNAGNDLWEYNSPFLNILNKETSIIQPEFFPVPSSGNLNLSYQLNDKTAQFIIIDMMGKVCHEEILKGDNTLFTFNLSHLPAGYYSYKLMDGGNQFQGKIILSE